MSTSTEPDATERADLTIGGMTCASCAMRIEKKLNRLDGVTATVNYATEQARITHPEGTSIEELIAQVESAGYTARLPRSASAGTGDGDRAGGEDEIDESRPLRVRLITSLLLAVPVIALAMIPALQFDAWQWLSLTLAAPVVTWGRGRSTRPPGQTSATPPPPWTLSSPSAWWPPSGGRSTPCSLAPPARSA